MSVRVDFRCPKKMKQMLKDIAKNRHLKDADVYREAFQDYLSSYSTIPSLKEVAGQVERHEKKLSEIERVLLKKGILE